MDINEIIAYQIDQDQSANIDKHYGMVLANFDKLFSSKPKISSEDEYLECHRLKGILSSLSCYTSNTNHPDNDKVWEMEGIYGAALANYNKKHLIKDKFTKTLARYLIWDRYFDPEMIDHNEILRDAASAGILVKKVEGGNTTLYVVGLHYKVGDNVFTVDRRGREHRRYTQTIGRQAIPVEYLEEIISMFIENNPAVIDSIPVLNESYYVTYVADMKMCIKPISMRKNESDSIFYKYAKACKVAS